MDYDSTGTSYSQFQINAFGGRYRIFSDQEYKKATKQKGKSPGFKLVNKTVWPVAYSFEQVGCLYHDVASSIVITAPQAAANQSAACFNRVQGKVAWSRGGSKKWGPNNVKRLCANSRNPANTVACFKRGINSHNSWEKAIQECAGKF